MSFAQHRASWGRLNSSADGEDIITRVTSVGQAAADAIQEAADELEAGMLDEQDRVARMTEQLVLDGRSRPENLENKEARVATFQLVWKGAVTGRKVAFPPDRLSTERLAWAGFYYLPDARVEDRTVCFSCGKALHSWDATDDPLYEHCKASPDCAHVRALADDNLAEEEAAPPTVPPKEPTSPAKPPANIKIDWRSITDPMPRDSVVDHLIMVVHGIGTNDETLPVYLEQLRAGVAPAWQRKYLDIPLSVAVDAISWHGLARAPQVASSSPSQLSPHSPCIRSATSGSDRGDRAPLQEIMSNITLPTVPSVREVINGTMLDVLYYRSPIYGQQLIDVVAKLLNEKVALYKKEFPHFSGQVSLYCHSLGSAIVFDLLQNQRPTKPHAASKAEAPGTAPSPNPKRRSSTVEFPEGEIAEEMADTWQWPQLTFKVDNMFALGGARLFNIFDPTDPVAFRFEPLINPRYAQLPAALVPARHRRSAPATEETPKAARADFFGWQRIDYALQEGSDSGLMGHIRAISNAHHCYWLSKDLSLFILDTILTQKLYVQDPSLEQDARDVEENGPRAPRGEAHEREVDWAMEVLSVKEQVMWLLTSDLLAAEVAPIVGSRAGTTGGTFNYALGNLRVSSIDVPRHKVIVVCDKDDRVTVKATDISANLNGFTWLYKQKGPPHLKDSGTADATVGGLSLWLGLSRSQLTEGLAKRRRGSWVTPQASPHPSPALRPRHDDAGGGEEQAGDFPGLGAMEGGGGEAGGGGGGGARATEERRRGGGGGGFSALQTGVLPSVVTWLLVPPRCQEPPSPSGALPQPSAGPRLQAEAAHTQDPEPEESLSSSASFRSSRPDRDRDDASPIPASASASVASFGSSQGRSPDVRIKIRSLDIVLHKSSSAMMSWLYRMLLSAFSETIRSSVEEAVVWTLKERLRESS